MDGELRRGGRHQLPGGHHGDHLRGHDAQRRAAELGQRGTVHCLAEHRERETSPTSIPALEEALYDGAGQRVVQVAESNATTTTTQHTYVGGNGASGGSEDLASQWPNAGGAPTTTTTAYYGGGLAESVNGTLRDGVASQRASTPAAL